MAATKDVKSNDFNLTTINLWLSSFLVSSNPLIDWKLFKVSTNDMQASFSIQMSKVMSLRQYDVNVTSMQNKMSSDKVAAVNNQMR